MKNRLIAESKTHVLAIDSSSNILSLALSGDQDVINSATIDLGIPHSQTIFIGIIDLLEKAGVALDSIDSFAVITGPGSFTGLRVGLSVVKGLADALDKPSIGTNKLDLIALAANTEGLILVVLDAGKDNFHLGLRRIVSGNFIDAFSFDRTAQASELPQLFDWSQVNSDLTLIATPFQSAQVFEYLSDYKLNIKTSSLLTDPSFTANSLAKRVSSELFLHHISNSTERGARR